MAFDADNHYYEPTDCFTRYMPSDRLDEAERDFIEQALRHRGGHVTKTAADLRIERSHLYKKMRALGIRKSKED